MSLSCVQMEGDILPELLVAGHGVVLTLLSLLEQTFQKIGGASSGTCIMNVLSLIRCCIS